MALYFETEEAANEALLDFRLLEILRDDRAFGEAELRAMWRHNAALLNANGGMDLSGTVTTLDLTASDSLDYDNLFNMMVKTGTLKLGIVIGAQGPEAYGMPEMFTPMQHINANRSLRKLATLISDGRYSGVSYGAAIGHISPEAARGGDILCVLTGDLLHLRFRARRLDLLDPAKFLQGEIALSGPEFLAARSEIASERLARLKARQRRVAASNRMTYCTDASKGVLPQAVWDECQESFWDVAKIAGINA
jgi:hypothetical protein